MKMRRLLSCILALLLVVSLLPITAMAEEETHIESNQDSNSDSNVIVDSGVTVGTNTGNIVTNEGTITNNGTNGNGSGTVKDNEGTVTNNYGTIASNGTETDGASSGKGIVENNYGTIQSNGTEMGGSLSGMVNDNYGTIDANNGTVISNNESGNVGTNAKTGTIVTNNGQVGTLTDGGLSNQSGNRGTIETNNGAVTINDEDATIVTNNGNVLSNYGTVETNNGTVGKNYGTVETNAIDGVVNNYPEAPVALLDNEDAATSEEEPVVDGVGTNFGTVVDKTKEDTKTTYYGLSWGDSTENLTSIESFVEKGTPLDLDVEAAKAQRSGYKMTGYTAFARNNGSDKEITDITNHLMNAPVWLQILWEKIVTAVEPAPSEEPEVKTASILTSVSADQVKVGTFVRCGNMLFKIIEVNDDSIRVATVWTLSEAELADMLGCLKNHLSAEKIAKFIGEPELLEEESVARFFSDNQEHIAFRAAKDLFA